MSNLYVSIYVFVCSFSQDFVFYVYCCLMKCKGASLMSNLDVSICVFVCFFFKNLCSMYIVL